MGSKYVFNKNPLMDFIVELLMHDKENILEKDVQSRIKNAFIIFAKDYVNEEELLYFDFQIKRKNGIFKVIPDNFSSALFFCGIIPNSFKIINTQKELEFDGKLYIFDQVKKTVKIKKNNVKN